MKCPESLIALIISNEKCEILVYPHENLESNLTMG